MPHLAIHYPKIHEASLSMHALVEDCRECLASLKNNESNADLPQAVFPLGAIRVFATAADHTAIADGKNPYRFIFFQLTIAPGRSETLVAHIGSTLASVIESHLQSVSDTSNPPTSNPPWGATLQIIPFIAPDYRLGTLRTTDFQ